MKYNNYRQWLESDAASSSNGKLTVDGFRSLRLLYDSNKNRDKRREPKKNKNKTVMQFFIVRRKILAFFVFKYETTKFIHLSFELIGLTTMPGRMLGILAA